MCGSRGGGCAPHDVHHHQAHHGDREVIRRDQPCAAEQAERRHPGWTTRPRRDECLERSRRRQESQISSTPTLADFSSHLVCLDCSTFSLHRRRTESRRRWGKSGFGHAARALRDAPRRHALPSLLARARGRARFVTARPPAATRGTTASTASRRQPLSTSVTTSRFHKKTHSVGG